MKPLLARIVDVAESTDRRRAGRRLVSLDVPARSATAESSIVIRNISRTGLQIETEAAFAVGETFMLVLPEIGATPARVKWNRGSSYGCEFLSPVASGTISAIQLQSPFDIAANAIAEPAALSEPIRRDYVPNNLVTFVATTLFSAAILFLIFAFASLSFSAD